MTLTMPNTTAPKQAQEQEQSFEQFMIEYVNAHYDPLTQGLVAIMVQNLHPLSFRVRDGDEDTTYALFPQS